MTDKRTPRIRRRLKKLGLSDLQIASGATTKKELARAEAVVDKLIADRQVGVLRALMDPLSPVTLAALIDVDRAGQLAGGGILVTVAMRERLFPKGEPDAEDYEPGAIRRLFPGDGATEKRYRVAFEALRRKAPLADDARLTDLGTVAWASLSKRWGASGDDWENMRRAVSRLLTLAVGDVYHPARRDVMKLIPHQATRKRPANLTPDMLDDILDHTRADFRPAFMTLLLTGMRVKTEYLRCREAHLNARALTVLVPGTKTEGSYAEVRIQREDWPWIRAGIPAPVKTYKAFRKQWCRAVAAAGLGTYEEWIEVDEDGTRHERERYEGPGLHALRHAHGQWAADAGVPLTQIKASLRHATLAMTARYAEHAGKAEVAKAISGKVRRQAAGPEKPKRGRTASVSRQTDPAEGPDTRAAG